MDSGVPRCDFFMGLYIGHLMLRPFKRIGEYCQQVIDDPNIAYKNEDFSAYRLLTRFSEMFFEHLRDSRTKNKLVAKDIPPQYMGIHKPVFDGPFVFHFSFFLIIVMIVSIIAIMGFATDIHENTMQIALRMLKADPKVVAAFFKTRPSLWMRCGGSLRFWLWVYTL